MLKTIFLYTTKVSVIGVEITVILLRENRNKKLDFTDCPCMHLGEFLHPDEKRNVHGGRGAHF